MKAILLSTIAILSVSAAPALAQDDSGSAGGANFSGPRAEIFGGWDRIGTRTRLDVGTGIDTTKAHKSGATVGGLVGYDAHIGNRFVLGAFGSYALSTAEECSFSIGSSGCIKSGRQIEAGARFGMPVGEKALVYVKGAYVNGQIQATLVDDGDRFRGHANRDGWRAGAGVEYALNKHAYLKAEYDYTRFKSFDATDLGEPDTSVRFDRNQVVGGFGIRF